MPGFEISTDASRLDVDRIHAYLSEVSYWARGRPRESTELGIANSLCFGAYEGGGTALTGTGASGSAAPRAEQLGFARVFTDGVVLAWVADVFTFPEHRGRGIGKALMRAIAEHPDLQRVKRMGLITADAHGLYESVGFHAPANPGMWMERMAAPEHQPWSGVWSYDD